MMDLRFFHPTSFGQALLCLIFFCFSQMGVAQNIQAIDLATVMKLSGANNLTIKEYAERQDLAKAEYAISKSWWLPEIYAGVQTHALWGAAMNTDGRFSLETNRDNLWAGLGLDVDWDFSEGIYNMKSAKYQYLAEQHRSEVQHNKSILEGIETYYELLTAQLEYLAYQDLIKQSDSLSQQTEILVEAGLLYQSESLLAKSNLANVRIQSINAQREMARKSSELMALLNLNPQIKLICSDTLILPIELVADIQVIDYESAYLERPEMKALQLDGKALEYQRKKYTMGLAIPTLHFDTYQAYVGDFDGSVEALRPDLFPITKQLYSTQQINASLLWRIPLGMLTHGGELKAYDARIRLGQIKIQQQKANINSEILASQENARLTKEQLNLSAEASTFAFEALDQSLQRQLLGTVRPFEILQAQEIYISSRLNYIEAVSQYNIAQYRLYVAKGNKL